MAAAGTATGGAVAFHEAAYFPLTLRRIAKRDAPAAGVVTVEFEPHTIAGRNFVPAVRSPIVRVPIAELQLDQLSISVVRSKSGAWSGARAAQTAQAPQKAHDTKLRSAERRTRAKGDAATTFVRLDFLLSIARDSTATEVERRKVALAIAEFLLPKKQGAKKRGKFPTDELGFSVDPEWVREFRDISWALACLPLARKKFAKRAAPEPGSANLCRLSNGQVRDSGVRRICALTSLPALEGDGLLREYFE